MTPKTRLLPLALLAATSAHAGLLDAGAAALGKATAAASAAAPAPAASPAATATPAPAGNAVTTFIQRLEAARGSALGVAQKATVTGAVTQSRSLADAAQQKFLGTVGKTTGLDPAVLGAVYPKATQPLSQSEVVTGLEAKLGRKLAGKEGSAVATATTLRNNSLASLKGNLTGKVAKAAGVDSALVESLLPLIGF